MKAAIQSLQFGAEHRDYIVGGDHAHQFVVRVNDGEGEEDRNPKSSATSLSLVASWLKISGSWVSESSGVEDSASTKRASGTAPTSVP